MKRTAEIILGIVGAVFYLFSFGFGLLRVWIENNKDYMVDYLFENQHELGITSAEMDMATEFLMTNVARGGILLIIMPIIAIILGIVAIVLLKGNKNPKAAGIIFIATAVVFVIVTIGGGILSGLLYLIAGILALVRKPKTIIEE